MEIQVLLFASYRDRSGTDSLRLVVEEEATAGDVVDRIRREVGGLGSLPARVAIAVNETHAPAHIRLKPGDVVALIPPVSGG